ncbi:hypothetical protein [Kocuria sp. SM24M-10]|uniref:hypothetical protein n=1 Tax=Kocuria sp. SM24M-10 TaxID=1660349 RepID=UPI000649ECC4|nr:hypothetical protein [Kocuria sp. SM24M-10]KLU08089.1 hypothetical protein ABL57_19855 [Kocuria sp. SM24M-10]
MSTTPTRTTGMDIAHVLAQHQRLTLYGNADHVDDPLLAAGFMFDPEFYAEVDAAREWIVEHLAPLPYGSRKIGPVTWALRMLMLADTGRCVSEGAFIVAAVQAGAAVTWQPERRDVILNAAFGGFTR